MDSATTPATTGREAGSAGLTHVKAPAWRTVIPCGDRSPRRQFLAMGTKLAIGVTAVVGGLVKFTPAALAIVQCDFGYQQIYDNSSCVTSCIGGCSETQSCCYFQDENDCPNCYCCIVCSQYCTYGKVAVQCMSDPYQSYCCGINC